MSCFLVKVLVKLRKIYVQIEEHLKRRYPTRELMVEYEIYTTNRTFDKKKQLSIDIKKDLFNILYSNKENIIL